MCIILLLIIAVLYCIIWENVQNKNVSYYIVQRCSDGFNYKDIATVNCAATAYDDAAPLSGNSYYRIAAVAKDGSSIYSNAVLIPRVTEVSIYPNPVRDNMQGKGIPATGRTMINIADVNGSIRSITTVSGNSAAINTVKLSTGR